MTRMENSDNESATEYSGPPPDEQTACITHGDSDPEHTDFFYGRGYLGGALWHVGAALGLVEPPKEYRDDYNNPGIYPEE